MFVEYAKAAPGDILVRITAVNRAPDTGKEAALLDLLPTIWFRNLWSWGLDARRPQLKAEHSGANSPVLRVSHPDMPDYWLSFGGDPELLFTENETNYKRLCGGENPVRFVKDGINDYVVAGIKDVVNPDWTSPGIWSSRQAMWAIAACGGRRKR